MRHSTLVLFHICNATVGLLSGFLSMLFRKGSGLHRAAGTIFFGSIYLVATAWVAARRRDRVVGSFDLGALLVALAIAAAGATWGFEAARSQTGLKYGYPPGLYFVFGSIALLFAASDVRTIVRGGVSGAQRIARHLWRMCLALLMATLSLYRVRARKRVQHENVISAKEADAVLMECVA